MGEQGRPPERWGDRAETREAERDYRGGLFFVVQSNYRREVLLDFDQRPTRVLYGLAQPERSLLAQLSGRKQPVEEELDHETDIDNLAFMEPDEGVVRPGERRLP